MRAGRIALFGLAAVGALAIGIGAAEVQQRYLSDPAPTPSDRAYDDPAVAVCEFTRLRGRTPAPSDYTRQSAVVDGLVATITYTTSPLNTRPKEHEYSCRFKASEDGRFVLDREFTKRTVECTETMKKMSEELSEETPQERRDEMRKTVEECKKIIADERDAAFRTLIDEDLALTFIGVYPIEPDQTELRQ